MRLIDISKYEVMTFQDKSQDFVDGVQWILEQMDKEPTVKASPLDKVDQIRAEIANMDIYHYEDKDGYLVERRVDYDDVLSIIDKYLEG